MTFAGETWRNRFFKVKNHPNTHLFITPEELGPEPKGVNRYSRANLWQLYTALAWGLEKVHFICLWDRQSGDGPGGTKHMLDSVQEHLGQVHILDTNVIFA